MTALTGTRFRTLRVGGTRQLGAFIAIAKKFDRKGDDVFPAWQGMQYTRDMTEGAGALTPLDGDRYGPLAWTAIDDVLARRFHAVPASGAEPVAQGGA